jgi:hypothetical protein
VLSPEQRAVCAALLAWPRSSAVARDAVEVLHCLETWAIPHNRPTTNQSAIKCDQLGTDDCVVYHVQTNGCCHTSAMMACNAQYDRQRYEARD